MAEREEEALVIAIPSWVDALVASHAAPLSTHEQRMDLAVALASANVARGGGPFGAVVFAGTELVAAGVNRVLDSGFSIAHAEIVALMRAQRAVARGVGAGRPIALVTSTEPCCQCFGAVVWAGIDQLVCGATTADAEAIGFDEGPKPDDWPATLRARGIDVILDVRRSAARVVLDEYGRRGGRIYGRRSG